MLLTNDGWLLHRIPSALCASQDVLVQVERIPTEEALEALRRGWWSRGKDAARRGELLRGAAAANAAALGAHPPPGERPHRLDGVTLREGRKRQVRHMTAVGYPTLRLIRVASGPIALDLPPAPGELTDEELDAAGILPPPQGAATPAPGPSASRTEEPFPALRYAPRSSGNGCPHRLPLAHAGLFGHERATPARLLGDRPRRCCRRSSMPRRNQRQTAPSPARRRRYPPTSPRASPCAPEQGPDAPRRAAQAADTTTPWAPPVTQPGPRTGAKGAPRQHAQQAKLGGVRDIVEQVIVRVELGTHVRQLWATREEGDDRRPEDEGQPVGDEPAGVSPRPTGGMAVRREGSTGH